MIGLIGVVTSFIWSPRKLFYYSVRLAHAGGAPTLFFTVGIIITSTRLAVALGRGRIPLFLVTAGHLDTWTLGPVLYSVWPK